MNSNPIGVFDSGIGGLTVVNEILKQLPNESIIYLGDTARVPYGTRGKEVITKFALELANFLIRKKIKFLVVACNTISAIALPEIEKISPVHILGVVDPAVKKALKTTKIKKIGVIGTSGTINSKVYENKIKELDSKIEVVSVACPLFVPITEEGFNEHEATKMIAREYLEQIKSSGVDTLILGCTHYPLLDNVIQEIMGENVVLVDSAQPTAKELKKLLEEKKLLSENSEPTYQFFITDAPDRVYQIASKFFSQNLVDRIKKITL
ncbi:glutamate racemase [Candidatus Daviesbacteria bacterium]|nr:glutamate racemase [Candidatus Daviesbacteria bacterium]